MSLRDRSLQTLVDQHRPQWTAIRRWLSAGGNLWVYGVGQVGNPWQQLNEVNGRIEFAMPDDLSLWKDVPEALHGWNAPDPNAQSTYIDQYPQAQSERGRLIITEDGTTRGNCHARSRRGASASKNGNHL